MIQLTWIEFFIRVIPESFFVILLIHAFSKQAIDKKKYIMATLVYSILVFSVRMLPISYGIHTMVNLIMLILITSTINKIDIKIGIPSSILTLIFLFICELVNMLIVQDLLHLDIERMFYSVYIKTIYSSLSLVLLAFISIFSYYLLVIKKRAQNV